MKVQQTHSVIDLAREFHEQVGEYYHRLADAAQQTRVRLLLDYMSQHEQRLASALADYEDLAPKAILNTWLQSTEGDDALDGGAPPIARGNGRSVCGRRCDCRDGDQVH